MGWSFAMSTSVKKADVVARVRGGKFFSEGYNYITDRVVGNHMWVVLQEPNGKKTISLVLMAGGGRNMGWGYKGVSESMGPCELDCPLSLLKQVDEAPNEYARAWRKEVLAFHARGTQRRASIRPGAHVKYGGQTYKLLEKLSGRRGWIIEEVETGTRYRLSYIQLARAAVVAEPVKAAAPNPQVQQALELDCATT